MRSPFSARYGSVQAGSAGHDLAVSRRTLALNLHRMARVDLCCVVQMERTMAASEAKKAAQKQAATGLDAMLDAMRGAKKARASPKPLASPSPVT